MSLRYDINPQKPSIVSMTGIIDRRKGQFNFSEPPPSWRDIFRLGSKIAPKLREPYWILKLGYNGENTGRHNTHDIEYGDTCRIIDSFISPVAAAAEIRIKDLLLNEGKLFGGLHSSKKTRDTELIIIKSQAEYAEYVQIVQSVILNIEMTIYKERQDS